ncbi:MAG TPA: hypothetical protein VF283_09980 [Bryobacteraceae bacterium]
MGGYLEHYERGEASRAHRTRIIKWVIIACIIAAIAVWIFYMTFHNRVEVQKARHFLAQVNAQHYQQAYATWGCTSTHPCPNYNYQRFMEDWGPKVAQSPWKVDNIDACKYFVTVNVKAKGAPLASLAVERGPKHVLSFAPFPRCREKQWHWGNFFHRIFGGGKQPSGNK